MYNIKYRLTNIEEFGKHNPLYDDILGCICYPAYFHVGERGLFLYEIDEWFDVPHRIHTSVVKDVTNTRGNAFIVTTQNTRFTFKAIAKGEQ